MIGTTVQPSSSDDTSKNACFSWDRNARLSLASSMIPLPAEYLFAPCPENIEGWKVREEPSPHAEHIGKLNVGDRFFVHGRFGFWLHMTIPGTSKMGWALAEIDGYRYLRPLDQTTTYRWQRQRYLGLMYEDVLMKRKVELRDGPSLATNRELLNEWGCLIAELNNVRQLSRGFKSFLEKAQVRSPSGSKLMLRQMVERPRSNSFQSVESAKINLPVECINTSQDSIDRPRSNSISVGREFSHNGTIYEKDRNQWIAWADEQAGQIPKNKGRWYTSHGIENNILDAAKSRPLQNANDLLYDLKDAINRGNRVCKGNSLRPLRRLARTSNGPARHTSSENSPTRNLSERKNPFDVVNDVVGDSVGSDVLTAGQSEANKSVLEPDGAQAEPIQMDHIMGLQMDLDDAIIATQVDSKIGSVQDINPEPVLQDTIATKQDKSGIESAHCSEVEFGDSEDGVNLTTTTTIKPETDSVKLTQPSCHLEEDMNAGIGKDDLDKTNSVESLASISTPDKAVDILIPNEINNDPVQVINNESGNNEKIQALVPSESETDSIERICSQSNTEAVEKHVAAKNDVADGEEKLQHSKITIEGAVETSSTTETCESEPDILQSTQTDSYTDDNADVIDSQDDKTKDTSAVEEVILDQSQHALPDRVTQSIIASHKLLPECVKNYVAENNLDRLSENIALEPTRSANGTLNQSNDKSGSAEESKSDSAEQIIDDMPENPGLDDVDLDLDDADVTLDESILSHVTVAMDEPVKSGNNLLADQELTQKDAAEEEVRRREQMEREVQQEQERIKIRRVNEQKMKDEADRKSRQKGKHAKAATKSRPRAYDRSSRGREERRRAPVRNTKSRSRASLGFDDVPLAEPDVTSLYKWSWEKDSGQLNPNDYQLDPLLKDQVQPRQDVQSKMVDVPVKKIEPRPKQLDPNKDQTAASAQKGGRDGLWNNRSRSTSLHLRKSDGARHKLFVPAKKK